MENILIELGTPIWSPSSCFFETSNISLFMAFYPKSLAPQKYHGSTFELKD
jgi:hypothetical protein